jgi:hypothetical protein
MADNLTKPHVADRSAAHEVDYWIATLGVSPEQLARTMHKVGATPDNMRPELARVAEKA